MHLISPTIAIQLQIGNLRLIIGEDKNVLKTRVMKLISTKEHFKGKLYPDVKKGQ
jgi:hypothetical protein